MPQIDQMAHQSRHALAVVGADEGRVEAGVAARHLYRRHVAQQRATAVGQPDGRIEQDAGDTGFAQGPYLGLLDSRVVLGDGEQQVQPAPRAGASQRAGQGAEEIGPNVGRIRPMNELGSPRIWRAPPLTT